MQLVDSAMDGKHLGPTSVLLVSPSISTGGNSSTLSRIQKHLSSAGYHTELTDIATALQCLQVHQNGGRGYDIIMAIHAYKSARLCDALACDVKLVLIFGGTDLNEDAMDDKKAALMSKMVERSDKCIAFSQEMLNKALCLWSWHGHKFTLIHQGVETMPRENYDFRGHVESRLGRKVEYLAILVAGIRPVKDVTYVLEAFARASDISDRVALVLVGAIMDSVYWDVIQDKLDGQLHSNIVYIGELSVHETHAAIQRSDFLMNSSRSEGMSGAILEAFQLGTPVIARENSGNTYLIQHGHNGMLYRTPDEFVLCLQTLISDMDFSCRLVDNAQKSVKQYFDFDKERQLYKKVLNDIQNNN